jgi:hypothetical protein
LQNEESHRIRFLSQAMSTGHEPEPLTKPRRFSILGVIANAAWVLGAGSILAPSMLDLSASGKTTANVMGGIAFFVFFVCGVIGFVRATSHRRMQEKSVPAVQPKRPKEGT